MVLRTLRMMLYLALIVYISIRRSHSKLALSVTGRQDSVLSVIETESAL